MQISGSEGRPDSPSDSLDGTKKGERKKEFVCQVGEPPQQGPSILVTSAFTNYTLVSRHFRQEALSLPDLVTVFCAGVRAGR